MNAITGCCKECTNRHEACHDTCVKYLMARAKWSKQRKAISEAKNDPLYLYKVQSIRDQKAKKDKRSLKK